MIRKALILSLVAATMVAPLSAHARSRGNVAFSGVPTQTLIELIAQGEYFFRKCNHLVPMPKTLARNIILKRELSDRVGVYAMVVSLSETTAMLDKHMTAQLNGVTVFPRKVCQNVASNLEIDLGGM